MTPTIRDFFKRFAREDQDVRALAHEMRNAAKDFINSPAYALLLEKVEIGKIPPEGEEQNYLAMQYLIYQLNAMANLDVAAVMKQVVRVDNGDVHGLGDS